MCFEIGNPVVCLRSDNGSEYVGKELKRALGKTTNDIRKLWLAHQSKTVCQRDLLTERYWNRQGVGETARPGLCGTILQKNLNLYFVVQNKRIFPFLYK
jgi:hypothetical protein